MKRGGRQHGMVRTTAILPPPLRPVARHVNKLGSPPTAGMFTKVSSKPTNHSKFTSKCGRPRCNGCHIHPAWKAKDKAKGAQKLRLITWRVVDTKPGFKFSGSSASDILDQLTYLHMDDDCDIDGHVGGVLDGSSDHDAHGTEIEDTDEYENDDKMSFCEVGFVLEPLDLDGDESWCLVEEM